MMCNWKELLGILPQGIREQVNIHRDTLQELRMRINAPPEFILTGGSRWGSRAVRSDDIGFCINAASRYSPWSASTAAQGYLSVPGGHRMGLCGDVVCQNGNVTGIREVRSLCIRVARDYPGIAAGIPTRGNILILGSPGWGKTTLLRDLIRQRAEIQTVAVADERYELFPPGFVHGKRMDLLTGAPKTLAMDRLLRTMRPDCIAVDEITAEEDCTSFLQAWSCGVNLLATAHASSMEDYRARDIYRPLRESGVFDSVIVLHSDKTWHMERMKACVFNG